MTTLEIDAFDRALVQLRGLAMAIRGADSIADEGEKDALEGMAASVLDAFERVQAAAAHAPNVVALHAA